MHIQAAIVTHYKKHEVFAEVLRMYLSLLLLSDYCNGILMNVLNYSVLGSLFEDGTQVCYVMGNGPWNMLHTFDSINSDLPGGQGQEWFHCCGKTPCSNVQWCLS